jgi:hypothetical protein
MHEIVTCIAGVEGVRAYACDCGEVLVDADEAGRVEALLCGKDKGVPT